MARPKKVYWTNHARRRAKQRDLREHDLEVIARSAYHLGFFKHRVTPVKIAIQRLRVVCVHKDDRLLIITVYADVEGPYYHEFKAVG